MLFNDPFQINGTFINNVFQTLSFPIAGSGSSLELELTAFSNGSAEVIAIDKLQILAESVPEPGSSLVILLAGLATSFRRRR